MDSKQKQEAKFKLGICINKIIAKNKTKNNPDLVTSLRKLAAACDVEYSIIQKITSGKKDPQLSDYILTITNQSRSNSSPIFLNFWHFELHSISQLLS